MSIGNGTVAAVRSLSFGAAASSPSRVPGAWVSGGCPVVGPVAPAVVDAVAPAALAESDGAAALSNDANSAVAPVPDAVACEPAGDALELGPTAAGVGAKDVGTFIGWCSVPGIGWW